jgi:hypothetical protein
LAPSSSTKVFAGTGRPRTCLHWTLDVVFREDDSRIRVGHGAENFAIIRRMSLNLMNQNTTTKIRKNCLRKIAAWNTKRPEDILGLHDRSARSESVVT